MAIRGSATAPPSCPAGCGGGWRGELHHPVLHPAGRGGLPPPLWEPRHLRPGRAVHHQSSRKAPEAGHLRATLLLLTGVQPPSVLPGWHSGCPEGRWLQLGPRTSHLETGCVCTCTKCMNTSVWPPKMQLQEQIRRFIWGPAGKYAVSILLMPPKGYFCLPSLISFNEKFRSGRFWQWDAWMVNNLLLCLSQLCSSYKRSWHNCSHSMFLLCATSLYAFPFFLWGLCGRRLAFDNRLLLYRINGLNSWCYYCHSFSPIWSFKAYSECLQRHYDLEGDRKKVCQGLGGKSECDTCHRWMQSFMGIQEKEASYYFEEIWKGANIWDWP